MNEIRDGVRERYTRIASEIAGTNTREGETSCCGEECCGPDVDGCGGGYDASELVSLGLDPRASLGCGNPTLMADLRPGDTVLDLGSGAGIDVLLSARRVGPAGHAFGVDMTDEMLTLARANQASSGVANATFLKGTIEELPLPDQSVDVVISNCVINLAADKRAVLQEAFRVLRPGGRLAVTDMVALLEMPPALKGRMDLWAGCVAGTIGVDVYAGHLRATGFEAIDIDVEPNQHPSDFGGWIASAAVRATKPPAG